MMEWIKKHPYAAGAIVLVGGVILYILSRSGSSASGGSVASLAAQNSAASLQAAQVNAQEQTATEETQAQLDAQSLQTEAATQANQDTIAGQVIGEQIAEQANIEGEGIQAGLYEELGNNELQLQEANNQLAETGITTGEALAEKGGSEEQAGLNLAAIATGQGSISSYNEGAAAEKIASEQANASIFGNLINTGGSILSGLI